MAVLLGILIFLVPAEAALPENLSDTGLYEDFAKKLVKIENRPFTPQYPLWADGLSKKRWVYLPALPIETGNNAPEKGTLDYWIFPSGTKFWKEFSFGNRRIETRVLEKIGDGSWDLATYVWDEAETDAVKAVAAGIRDHVEIAPNIRHNIPSLAECRRCHSRGGDAVLGFDALQLSGTRKNDEEITFTQLLKEGRLTYVPNSLRENPPKIAASSEIGSAAMGYLHGNCGHCHNPHGAARFTGLYMRHSLDALVELQEPAFATAVNQLTSGFQIPDQDETYRLLARHKEKSAIYYRMNQRQPGQSMPPIATKLIDSNAVELIRQWIETL